MGRASSQPWIAGSRHGHTIAWIRIGSAGNRCSSGRSNFEANKRDASVERCPLDAGPGRSKLINTENSVLTSVDHCGEQPVPLDRGADSTLSDGSEAESRTTREIRKLLGRTNSANRAKVSGTSGADGSSESLRLRATGRRSKRWNRRRDVSRRVAALPGTARHGEERLRVKVRVADGRCRLRKLDVAPV